MTLWFFLTACNSYLHHLELSWKLSHGVAWIVCFFNLDFNIICIVTKHDSFFLNDFIIFLHEFVLFMNKRYAKDVIYLFYLAFKLYFATKVFLYWMTFWFVFNFFASICIRTTFRLRLNSPISLILSLFTWKMCDIFVVYIEFNVSEICFQLVISAFIVCEFAYR